MVEVMIILEKGAIRIKPDPIELNLYDELEFLLIQDVKRKDFSKELAKAKKLKWKIIFENEIPFAKATPQGTGGGGQLILTKLQAEELEQVTNMKEGERGKIKLGVAMQRGEHKYGIEIVDAETNENIEDIDPIIIIK
ncbi:hypothetical protein [Flavilitoribacter nigricans]|uniref:Uncharacterized protein n=1 Tax=Flavilitoribacter nigricans (strain ATCC 23147 / DSM 23189 / NBRC 102662 / NCIMB 1420 / SS-2) TaxID=1122177 RepID=A0A2D0N737_FLAN2|nr:hypothetical protein [Flavilitoribacter nigricans]PHN04342.1 hypothetical protein CRP01_22535 [Flavilitoribacter nigricans DSM 23189 = NBRC 102662]